MYVRTIKQFKISIFSNFVLISLTKLCKCSVVNSTNLCFFKSLRNYRGPVLDCGLFKSPIGVGGSVIRNRG